MHGDAPLGGLEFLMLAFSSRNSIVAAMNFQVLMICHRILQAQYVLTGRRIKAVQQDSVGRTFVPDKFEFRVVNDDVAVFLDSKFAANLQNDFHFVWFRFHVSSAHRDAGFKGETHARA
jgi:predicted secreted protein